MTTVYLEPAQKAALDALRERVKVPVAELLRQAVAVVVSAHREGATEGHALAAETLASPSASRVEKALAEAYQALHAEHEKLRERLRVTEAQEVEARERLRRVALFVEAEVRQGR